jgi:uncharacterized RDD family membrane protein YckC
MSPSTPTFIVRGDDGRDYGPVDLNELRDWVRENRAGLGTTVRLDEPGALWQPWQYYPELVALLAESQAVGVLAGSVLASIPRRMVAFIIDFILAYILLVPIMVLVLLFCFPDTAVSLAVWYNQGEPTEPPIPVSYDAAYHLLVYAAVTLYMAGFHWAHGRTPAKSILRLRVVDQNGQNPSLSRALVRGLILSVSLGLFLFPFLYVFFNPQRRALHDLAAGTYVVDA